MTTDAASDAAENTDAPTSIVRSVCGWVYSIASWLALFVMVAVLAAVIVIPRVAGGEVFTVTTGSMSPAYPPGTLIVTRSATPADIGIGTVLTYQLESGVPTVVTHRVVEISSDVRGRNAYVTQGDANPVVDANPVRAEQVRGKLWYSLPYLGYVNSAFSGQQRTIVFWAVFAALLVYALYMFLSARRDSRRRAKEGAEELVPDDRARDAETEVTR